MLTLNSSIQSPAVEPHVEPIFDDIARGLADACAACVRLLGARAAANHGAKLAKAP